MSLTAQIVRLVEPPPDQRPHSTFAPAGEIKRRNSALLAYFVARVIAVRVHPGPQAEAAVCRAEQLERR